MKGTRLIILILSFLLLTVSSGLLFYKNLFLLESPSMGSKVDFEELRYADQHINATTAMLRKNISSDPIVLDEEIVHVKELMNIITDVNKSTLELNTSIGNIQVFFDKKILEMNEFKIALGDLKKAVYSLNPAYNELVKNKIQFQVDKKDFYRESVLDAVFYVAIPTKENADRVIEDKKILGQILNFASSPNPVVQKFSAIIDVIYKRTNDLEKLTENFNRDNSIKKEMSIVGQYYREAQNAKARDGEVFLTMVFGAIVLYLIALVVILKKLT